MLLHLHVHHTEDVLLLLVVRQVLVNPGLRQVQAVHIDVMLDILGQLVLLLVPLAVRALLRHGTDQDKDETVMHSSLLDILSVIIRLHPRALQLHWQILQQDTLDQ